MRGRERSCGRMCPDFSLNFNFIHNFTSLQLSIIVGEEDGKSSGSGSGSGINGTNIVLPEGFNSKNFVDSSSSSGSNNFIEPLPSSFTGMFGEECSMYRLHGNVPQNVRQTVYKDFCKAKTGIMLCTGEYVRHSNFP